jgi:hypothetical protein
MSRIKRISFQLERLRRHYVTALETRDDQIALADMAHVLRVWTEMRADVDHLLPASHPLRISFITGTPSRKAIAATGSAPYLLVALPGGVYTRAADGTHDFRFPFIKNCGEIWKSEHVMLLDDGMLCNRLCVVYAGMSEAQRAAIKTFNTTKLSFTDWLGAEAVRVRFAQPGQSPKVFNVSRLQLIKRVANTLNASHHGADEKKDERENRFDAPVRFMLEFVHSSLTVPYFILMKVAQDILETVPQMLEAAEKLARNDGATK